MSSTVIPTMRYDDATKAVHWLCDTFAFESHNIYHDEKGRVVHAELKHGSGLIMIGPNVPSEFGKFIRVPKQVGGIETQVVYIMVPDLEAHFKRSQEKGAEILLPLKKQDYGASDYTCRDFEGHIWSFGDYNPWEVLKR